MSQAKQAKHQVVECLNHNQPEAALALLQALLVEDPANGDYWDYQLAACAMARRFEEAEAAYLRCEQLGVRYPETLNNAANNAGNWGRADRLLHYADLILQHFPDEQNSGLQFRIKALWMQRRYAESLAACGQLLQSAPEDVTAHQYTIKNQLSLGRPGEALARCNRQLAQLADRPELPIFAVLRIEALIAYGALSDALQQAKVWIARHPDDLDPQIHSALCFFSQFDADLSVQGRRQLAENFARVLQANSKPFTHWANARQPEKPLHIGLLSGDLREHPVGYFVEPVLRQWHQWQHRQHQPITVTVFDTLNQADGLTQKLRPLVSGWHDVTRLTTRQLGEQIRQLGVDILIDLHGHTTGHRLDVMALKPAPVQLTWHGFLGTTGLPTIDYVLADRISVPESAEDEFTEQVWRLPHYYCFAEPDIFLPEAQPPVLRNGFITFGSLSKPNKLNDRVLALWAQLLRDIPKSRLLIKGNGLNVPEFRQQFQRRLLIQGFDLERVTLEGPAPRQQFLATYQNIDIALDTFPYAGATTIMEALWCGVPIISLQGDRMVWRMAESILSQAGFPHWVAPDETQFIELARTLAANPAGLASQRERQRQQLLESSLFDRVRYAEDLAEALRGMWRAYCRNTA